MATPSNDPNSRRWADLAARAAATPAPPIDVFHAVMASLPSRGPRAVPGWPEKLLSSFHHWQMRAVFSGWVIITTILAYEGYRRSEDLSILLSLAF